MYLQSPYLRNHVRIEQINKTILTLRADTLPWRSNNRFTSRRRRVSVLKTSLILSKSVDKLFLEPCHSQLQCKDNPKTFNPKNYIISNSITKNIQSKELHHTRYSLDPRKSTVFLSFLSVHKECSVSILVNDTTPL